MTVKSSYINSVQQDTAGSRIKQAANQLHKCCFSCPIQANNSKLLARSNGQVEIMNRILFRVGIAERDLFQLYFATSRQIRDRHTALKTEGFRDIQIFPDRVEVKALLTQRGKLIQNTGNPCCEAADSREIQQESGSRKIFIQRHVDQIEVSNAVPKDPK